MKVSVFRVEEPRGGCGPYKGSPHAEALSEMYAEHGSGANPAPQEDPLLGYVATDEHCGFATIEALDAWFEDFHDVLEECGYVIVVYSVPMLDVRYGSQQLLFRRGDAVPSRILPML